MSPIDELIQHTLNDIAKRRLPESTYRLQFHSGFTFRDATGIVDYLNGLGVTDCYASPYLTARPGSTHGYDVIDHNRINPELGGEAGFLTWVGALARHGMSHILDTVPNHAGIATNNNAWWNDVLAHGPASRYANFFDVTWRGSPQPELHDKVLLPVLGAPYGEVLEKGELKLTREDGAPTVKYYDRRFPVSHGVLFPSPGTPGEGKQLESFNGAPGDPRSFDALDALLNQQSYRLAYWRNAPEEINYRRFFDINDLAALRQEREEVFLATHALTLRLLAEGKVAGLRIDHPDGLLDPEQYFQRLQREYVVACARNVWEADPRFAGQNWDDLVLALRERLDRAMSAMPDAGRPLYVVAEKILAAGEPLRVDWPIHGTSGYDFLNMANGLFIDPANRDRLTHVYQRFTGRKMAFGDVAYQKKKLILKTAFASELNMLAFRLDRLAQKDRHSRDFTLSGLRRGLCEAIACFPVYRSYITQRGVPPADRPRVESAVADAVARNPSIDVAVFHFIRDTLLLQYPNPGSDANRREQCEFAGRFQQLAAPVTAKGVEDTAFYVYNRLLSLNEVGGDPAQFGVSPDALHKYLRERQSRWPYALSALTTHDTKRSEDARARIDVLSEIPDEWQRCIERWSKVNERHRLAVGASTAPDRNEEYMLYQSLIGAWPLAGRPLPPSPSPGTPGEGRGEGLFFENSRKDPHHDPLPEYREGETDAAPRQVSFVDRIQQYMQKALREAKVHATWTEPNEAYENAIAQFVARILDPGHSGEFLADFDRFAAEVSHWGMLNSLSQTLLRLTAPGVPDTYQGTELWDFSLVDPDNRRPVDYSLRRRLLDSLQAQALAAGSDRREMARELLGNWEDGRVKMYVTRQVLQCRRQQPGLFTHGEYLPLIPTGPRRDHVFAFARRLGEKIAVVIIPRLFARLSPDAKSLPLGEAIWQDTHCPVPGGEMSTRLHNVFTGESIEWEAQEGVPSLRIASALAEFPIAVFL
jgi:(1->4)-alpha-D-glucan 1-alpha-D-glucosylmutase